MSDDYTPTTALVRAGYSGAGGLTPGVMQPRAACFDRWLEAHEREVRADAVMGFATHYLPHALWVKAKQYADDIREGNA